MIAKVAVAFPYSDPFDYQIPPGLEGEVSPGVRVLVPLRNRSVVGVVVECVDESRIKSLKEIYGVVDAEPVYSARMLSFTRWIAQYYLCSWAEVLEAALPGGMKPRIKQSIRVDMCQERFQALEQEERDLLLSLQQKPVSALKSPKLKLSEKKINQWKRGNLLRILPSIESKNSGKETDVWLCVNDDGVGQITVKTGSKADTLLRLLEREGSVSLAQVKSEIPNIGPVIKKLKDRSAIVLDSRPVEQRSITRHIADERFLQLNAEQNLLFGTIEKAIEETRYRTFLIHGVTGSGKTEVYLHAVRKTLLQGRSALILIPEISLTPQAVERFEYRFGGRVAVLHSGMSDKARAAEWWKIKNRQCDIVIGARSAIFAPLSNIGLIVVDEEHDSSYKQQETPFYHARDSAVKLASDLNAVVILGSATPSIESFFNARNKKYHLVELTQRANLKPLPTTLMISLKDEKRQAGAFYLSTVLVDRLKETLQSGKQVLVFLNRRGFASFLSCKACEMPVLCRNCSIAMTWHKIRKRLVCHHCGDTQLYPAGCGACGEKAFKMEGIGTQRVEQDLKRLFPEARFLRMDRDSIQKRGSLEKSIETINRRDVDFIIGTQLISKGHDFKHIGAVCIVLADMSLNFPDFRSSERSFQLISQVSGRAGRDELGKGITLIQTYNLEHFAIKTAVENDYDAFYRQEIEARRTLGNPPFFRLVLLKVSSNVAENARASALKLGALLKGKEIVAQFQVLGPIEAPIQKINNRYYWQVLLKTENAGPMKQVLKQVFWERNAWQPVGSTRVSIDVDPYTLL